MSLLGGGFSDESIENSDAQTMIQIMFQNCRNFFQLQILEMNIKSSFPKEKIIVDITFQFKHFSAIESKCIKFFLNYISSLFYLNFFIVFNLSRNFSILVNRFYNRRYPVKFLSCRIHRPQIHQKNLYVKEYDNPGTLYIYIYI